MVNETEQIVQKGDIVKSLDFNGIDNCYMVGEVVSVSKMDGTFRARFIKRIWQGTVDRKFKVDFFVAPLQGNHFLDRADSPRVLVVA